jgi:curved DNA-binding protein CbpA
MNTCSCGNPADDRSTLCPRCEALQILEVKADSSDEEIRAAYLLLVRVWHPDRFQNEDELKRAAEKKLKAINSAYCLLFATPAERDRRQRSQRSDSCLENEDSPEEVSPALDESQPPGARESIATPKGRSHLASFLGLTVLVRCSILLCVIVIGGFFLMTADLYLSTNMATANFYLGFRTQVVGGIDALKSNILRMVAGGLRKSDTAGYEAVANAQTMQATPAEPPVIHIAGRTRPHVVKVLPYITQGLTESEVLSVEGDPTSSSKDKMVYGRSELDFKDGELIGWKIDPSTPLRVKLWPDAPVDPSLRSFTVGSSKNEVLVIQGTPNVFSADMFGYGRSAVYFKNDRVVRWNEDPASVPLRARD